MEEIKQGWKKRISWLLIAITVVIVYKMLDNFSSVQAWFGSFLRIIKTISNRNFNIIYIIYTMYQNRKNI